MAYKVDAIVTCAQWCITHWGCTDFGQLTVDRIYRGLCRTTTTENGKDWLCCQVPQNGAILTLLKKDTDRGIKPFPYQMHLTPSTISLLSLYWHAELEQFDTEIAIICNQSECCPPKTNPICKISILAQGARWHGDAHPHGWYLFCFQTALTFAPKLC